MGWLGDEVLDARPTTMVVLYDGIGRAVNLENIMQSSSRKRTRNGREVVVFGVGRVAG